MCSTGELQAPRSVKKRRRARREDETKDEKSGRFGGHRPHGEERKRRKGRLAGEYMLAGKGSIAEPLIGQM
jgi:hypothetical protein